MSYAITREKFMNQTEMKKLIKVCRRRAEEDYREGRRTWITRSMLVHTALHSGLRVSEICSLKIGDLCFHNPENYLIVQCGKRKKRRAVYLDPEIVKMIQNYIKLKSELWHEPIQEDSPLFTGRGGEHFTTTALHISFKRAIEEAGLPKKYSIHSARHTYATMLLYKCKSIRFTMRQMGHENINMTCLYADVLPEMNQNLANTILK